MAALAAAGCGGGGDGASSAQTAVAAAVPVAATPGADAAAPAAPAPVAALTPDTAASDAVADSSSVADVPAVVTADNGTPETNALLATAQASQAITAESPVLALASEEPALAVVDAAPTAMAAGMATTQAVLPAAAASLNNLTVASQQLTGDIKATVNCIATYVAPARLTATAPVPASALLTLDAADLGAMRRQMAVGPFARTGDFARGTPDEMARLARNAGTFLAKGEGAIAKDVGTALRATHGSLARDAAYYHVLVPTPALVAKLRTYLLAQVADTSNDFSKLHCIRNLDGSVRDAWYGEASWLARLTVTYDGVRANLAAADRLLIENYIRRNAYFLAAQMDYGFAYVFPQRASNNYAVRAASAAATTDATRWATRRMDTNGDCTVDSKDDARDLPVYAYTLADGTAGPRLSTLSQWYNNRKSTSAMAIGMAGLLLGDAELTTRAKRYFMEWLTYSVYPDGSEGEYLRNGDYCIPNQGLVYAASNVQGAALLADMLVRRGDRALVDFRTRDGLYGSEAAATQLPKSIELVINTHIDLAAGRRAWYQHRPWLSRQAPTAALHLGKLDNTPFGSSKATDDYHQLGLLLAAKQFTGAPVRDFVLRQGAFAALRFPGSTGNSIATGFGSWAGAWTDAGNVYPSALMLRAN